MFLSAGVRFEANVEALNSVETTGNFSKHRKIPYIIWSDGKSKYDVIYVPAVSGESLAHAYQELLVREALQMDASAAICDECKRGEFFKSMNKEHLKGKVSNVDGASPQDIERGVVTNCLVEDIGGFLYAEKPPVKRSSAFQFSYAVPIKKVALLSVTEPLLHARHAQMREMKKKSKREGAAEQMIYYVESGTAIYGFTFNLDLNAIGLSSFTGEPLLDGKELGFRQKTAIRAFARMISSRQFGAKLSRFFPVGDILTVYVSLTDSPFSVTSPIYQAAALTTAKRLSILKEKFKEEVSLIVYDPLDGTAGLDFEFVEIVETPEEVGARLLERGL